MRENLDKQRVFAPLHVKSDYSLGYGTASVEELVERAVALGYGSLALTDLENLYAQVRFHHHCRLRGIRPITGVELRPGFDGRRTLGTKRGRIILLAREEAGYRNLCRIVSRRRGAVGKAGSGPLPDPLPLAARYSEGLFALSDDTAVVERLLAGGSFGTGDLGLLLVRPAAKVGGVAAAALRLGVPLVADLDALLLQRGDHPLHLLQLAVAQGRSVEEVSKDADVESPERLLLSPAHAASLFADLPEAVSATSAIADRCRFELGGGDETAHVFNRDTGKPDLERLTRICQEAKTELLESGKAWSHEHDKRLAEELSVLEKLGFAGFMLVVAEIISHCRGEGIPVAARGSAVSSLVLHLLGGSPVDPIRNGLLFERFLHEGKTAWPDVDLDLPWHRRDEVIEWIYRRFGREKVAMVAAMHTFRYRSALREGLKAFGAADSVIDDTICALPPEDLAAEEPDFDDPSGDASEWEPTRRNSLPPTKGHSHPDSPLPLIRRLVGRPRHIAVHPGGIVVDWRPLEDLIPLELAPKGVVVTQYDLVAVAKLGLVKIDLLGNRCLSEIEEALELAGWPGPLRLDAIPPEDPRTLELIDRARTIGCFQLESPAMRSLLARLPIRRQSDLTAALALIRPGASSGEMKTAFIRRARGDEPADPVFPVLADRLSESYGLPIYEEDIMALLSRTGGVTLAEADELRRGIVKSGGDQISLTGIQQEFLRKAQARYGNDRSAMAGARRAWSVAARFAAYSFNKAHAASYALLAYYSAYLKAHHPLEFGCALLNHHQGLYPMRTEVSELLRMGVPLRGPRVNLSEYHSVVEREECGQDGAVRIGLDKVKGLSHRAAIEVLSGRKSHGRFNSLRELLQRVRLNMREITALVLCGACDDLAPLSAGDYPFVHEAVLEQLRQQGDPSEPAGELFGERLTPSAETEAERRRLGLYQALMRVRNELSYLEMHLSSHPMALLREEAELQGCLPVKDALAVPAGSQVRLAALIAAMRRVPTRQGPMQFITFEDETGVLEAALMPETYRTLGERVTTPGPFLIEGRMRIQQGAAYLDVTRLRPFHEREKPYRR